MKAMICGLSGPNLTAEERTFFTRERPVGFILFRRNVESPAQVEALCAQLRACLGGADVLILIDQEGGRVQRLTQPHWPVYPAAARFGALHAASPDEARETAFIAARLIADDLVPLGINVDCLPVLDVPVEGAHDVIGDRAYARDPQVVATLGRAAAEGLMAGGVLPVIKHVPGHGRAAADSHLALPVVSAGRAALENRDFAPFRALADLPLAMTAHVVYDALDPAHPATLSARVIGEVIRGHIGFDGLLMSDDLSMAALSGDFAARTSAALSAGCDVVLHCNGNMDELAAVADAATPLAAPGQRRLATALAMIRPPQAFDRGQAEAVLAERLAAAV